MAIVEITGWKVGFNKVACTKIVRAATGLGLAEGKRVTDGVLDGKVQRVLVPSMEAAYRLADELTQINAIVTVVATPAKD